MLSSLLKPTLGYDGNYILTGSFDKTVKQWDIISGKCIQSWQQSSPVTSVATSENGKIIFGSKQQDAEL